MLFLLLLPLVWALTPSDRDNFLVSDLPGMSALPEDQVPTMFAGQLELYSNNQTHYFFWKFSHKNILPQYRNRTIFWLNGGPGCLSMDGALMEAGPFRIDLAGNVVYNDGSWHEMGDIIFVDQPAGTGFSYTKEYDHDLDQVGFHFLRFMERYYEMFPEEVGNDIFFAGESYAGQYIPYIADAIVKHNRDALVKYNLKGLLIGNGWIAPDQQSLSYLPYSLAAGIIDQNNDDFGMVLKQHERCQNVVNNVKGDSLEDFQVVSDTCEKILNYILEATLDKSAPKNQQCYNMYDYLLKDSFPLCGMNWPPDLEYVKPFLNEKIVQKLLNLKLFKNWNECSGKVGRLFSARHSIPSVKLLPGLLQEVPIVLYNGNRDIICNYVGTENFIKKLEWNGATGFSSDRLDWVYGKEINGYVFTERNLTYVNVFDSSHMVPFDMAGVSRSLMDLVVGRYKREDGSIIMDKELVADEPDKTEPEKVEESTAPESFKTSKPSATESESESDSDSDSDDESSPSKPSSSSSASPEDSDSTSSMVRVIELVALVLAIYILYYLYSSYSKPSSIIKTGPSTITKNVQWADLVSNVPRPSFLTRLWARIRRTDPNGVYTAPSEHPDDIELGTNEFVVESDEEASK